MSTKDCVNSCLYKMQGGTDMNRVYKMVAVCAVTVVAAVGVYSQEITKDDSKPAVVDQQTTTTQDYVFPTHRERFNRYLKSTVGPFQAGVECGLRRASISGAIVRRNGGRE